MLDVSMSYGQDLEFGAAGDLLTVTGSEVLQQKIMRRLLSNPGALLWHQDYGAGLGAEVGKSTNQLAIRGIILQQLRAEVNVSRSPGPKVDLTVLDTGLVICTITYVEQTTGVVKALSLPVGA